MPRSPALAFGAALAVLACVPGCRLDPPHVLPQVGARATWRDRGPDTESLANVAWFDVYHDDVLRRLIRIALAENPDLALALARIDEARALAKAAGAEVYPRLDLSAAAGAVKDSRLEVPVGDRTTGLVKMSFDVSWEVDLFGRVRSQASAAASRYFQSVEGHRDVGIRLVAEVARAYFELRELDDLLDITRRTLRSREEYVSLAKIRFEGGKTSEMDFRQAESEYFRTETVHVDVLRQTTSKENELSVLLGRSPDAVARGRPASEQDMPAHVPAGIPSDLLQRRPDIIGAGHLLAAETALVGAARANLYPRIALTGAYGWESDALSDLFTSPSVTSSLIAGLLQPIFDAGRNRALVEAQCARMRGAMESYRKVVLSAFAEVENALVDFRRFTEQRHVQARRVEALRRVLELAEIRYRGGVSQYLEVLDAQRALFDAEIEQADTIRSQLVSLTVLYKALGGGWDPQGFGGTCAPPVAATSSSVPVPPSSPAGPQVPSAPYPSPAGPR